MSIVLDYPTETQQLKVIAAEQQLDNLRVFIPEDDDIDYTDDTMIVFSDTRHTTVQNVLEFSRKVGGVFRRNVYVTGPSDMLDNNQMLKANSYAEVI